MAIDETLQAPTGIGDSGVVINGSPVLIEFDIVGAVGAANKVIVQVFIATANLAGKITFTYKRGNADEPESTGIEILQ